MAKKTNNIKFIQYFKRQESFTLNDVYHFFRNTQPDIKSGTVNWRIYHLVQQGVLQRIGRGIYMLGKERNFVLAPDKKQKRIAFLLKKQFPLANYCCWRLSILKEFYQHIATIDFIIVEVEKDTMDAVFHFLKESQKNIFKEPSKEIIEDFVSDINIAIIVKPMISESPLLQIDGISIPSLEKILVDLYTEKELFYFLQGNELLNIFKNAVGKYTVNSNKLLRYAKRRGKEEELQKILKQINGNS